MLGIFKKQPALTIIVLTLLMLGVVFFFPEVSIMEARNFITAREMVNDGNWLLTTMNGEPRYQKPPLPTWITALSMMIFGMKQLIFLRLPGILMVMAIGLFNYYFSKRISGDQIMSSIIGLITITSFYIAAIVPEAPWDIYAHGFLCLGIFNLFILLEGEAIRWKHACFSGVFIGASILSKGPIALYALLLPFLIAFGMSYRYRSIQKKILALITVLVIALIFGGWWFLYVRLSDPSGFQAITEKETSNWLSYNVRPIYYYWNFFVQSGIWTIPALMGLIYPYMKSRVSDLKAYRLTFYWTILSVVLLSLIPEKKSRYLMPVLIPLALNTGFYLKYIYSEWTSLKNKAEKIPLYFNAVIIALIGLGIPIAGYILLKNTEINRMVFGMICVLLLLIAIAQLRELIRGRMINSLLLVICFVVLTAVLITPYSRMLKSSNYSPISELQTELETSGFRLFKLDGVSPEMIWQYGDRIPSIKIGDEIRYPSETEFMLIAGEPASEEIDQIGLLYEIELIETYDLNISGPDSRNHKSRLRNQLYKVRKR
ncbi:MAG: glycosyltransferase [Flavobacteriaceae bacterium]|nr:glycosyltransferase [Flavobacteriaceae bacterium]